MPIYGVPGLKKEGLVRSGAVLEYVCSVIRAGRLDTIRVDLEYRYSVNALHAAGCQAFGCFYSMAIV